MPPPIQHNVASLSAIISAVQINRWIVIAGLLTHVLLSLVFVIYLIGINHVPVNVAVAAGPVENTHPTQFPKVYNIVTPLQIWGSLSIIILIIVVINMAILVSRLRTFFPENIYRLSLTWISLVSIHVAFTFGLLMYNEVRIQELPIPLAISIALATGGLLLPPTVWFMLPSTRARVFHVDPLRHL